MDAMLQAVLERQVRWSAEAIQKVDEEMVPLKQRRKMLLGMHVNALKELNKLKQESVVST